jgi:hypothetical protein
MNPPVPEKKFLTAEQLELSRKLWADGASRDEVCRAIGVTVDRFNARLRDQLADLPRRGRGGSWRGPTPDPTPAEIALACAEFRKNWTADRWLPEPVDRDPSTASADAVADRNNPRPPRDR